MSLLSIDQSIKEMQDRLEQLHRTKDAMERMRRLDVDWRVDSILRILSHASPPTIFELHSDGRFGVRYDPQDIIPFEYLTTGRLINLVMTNTTYATPTGTVPKPDKGDDPNSY